MQGLQGRDIPPRAAKAAALQRILSGEQPNKRKHPDTQQDEDDVDTEPAAPPQRIAKARARRAFCDSNNAGAKAAPAQAPGKSPAAPAGAEAVAEPAKAAKPEEAGDYPDPLPSQVRRCVTACACHCVRSGNGPRWPMHSGPCRLPPAAAPPLHLCASSTPLLHPAALSAMLAPMPCSTPRRRLSLPLLARTHRCRWAPRPCTMPSASWGRAALASCISGAVMRASALAARAAARRR